MDRHLVSLGLRGTALVGKLVIFIVMARFLDDADVGLFGLLVATVAYGSFVVGMEFYNYAVREVATSSGEKQSAAVVNHFSFAAMMQIVAVAGVLTLYAVGILTFELTIITLVLTLAEHSAQEGYRILIALSKPVYAAVCLFLRQGSWVFIVIIVFVTMPSLRTLEFVLYSWLTGVALAAVVSLTVIVRQTGLPNLAQFDPKWIIRGLPIAAVFVASSAGLQAINLLDRMTQAQLGVDGALAAYVLFFGLSITLIAALDAGVFSFRFPRIVAAGKRSDKSALLQEIKGILLPTAVGSLVFFAGGTVFFEFGLEQLGIGRYQVYGVIFYTLMVSAIFQAFSMVPHLGLYALRRDRILMFGNFSALAIFLVLIFLIQDQGDDTVALARAATFLFLACWKSFFLIRVLRRLA